LSIVVFAVVVLVVVVVVAVVVVIVADAKEKQPNWRQISHLASNPKKTLIGVKVQQLNWHRIYKAKRGMRLSNGKCKGYFPKGL